MDNKITKQRLKSLLSYDLAKIIIIIVAAILLWSLLFTMLGDAPSAGQKLQVYSYGVTLLNNEIDDLLTGSSSDYQSYEIAEATYYEFTESYATAQQFAAWSGAGEMDVIFASDVREITEDEDGNETEGDSIFTRYALNFYDYQTLAENALEYAGTHGCPSDGSVEEGKIKACFEKRKARSNSYRYGLVSVEQERDRIEKVRQNAQKLAFLLDSHPEAFVSVGEEGEERLVGFDVSKLDEWNRLLVPNTEDDGNEGICAVLAVFSNKRTDEDLFYESLAFFIRVVENYSTLLSGYAA